MVLRDAGIDTSGLKFKFGSDGTVTVMGEVVDDARRARIAEILEGMEQVKVVDNQLVVAVPEAEPGPELAAEAEPGTVTVGGGSEPTTADAEVTLGGPDLAEATEEEAGAGGDSPPAETVESPTYTVQSGDTLWKIAEEAYGSGAEYMKIFEANRDQLDNPDLIRPGQVLKIPPKS
jgi:nucleoid-associated protein YgaU